MRHDEGTRVQKIALDIDDLPVNVFDLKANGLEVEQLTFGHGMTEQAASSIGFSCSSGGCSACSGSGGGGCGGCGGVNTPFGTGDAEGLEDEDDWDLLEE